MTLEIREISEEMQEERSSKKYEKRVEPVRHYAGAEKSISKCGHRQVKIGTRFVGGREKRVSNSINYDSSRSRTRRRRY